MSNIPDVPANGNTPRKSNFELLRIVAMLMIVGGHMYSHGVQQRLNPAESFAAWNAGTLANKAVAAFFSPGGGIGVGIFFMLTGYFLAGKRKTSILKVSLQALYYAVFTAVLLFLSVAACNRMEIPGPFAGWSGVDKVYQVLHVLVPVSGGSWWFVSAYALLVLCAPLVNSFVDRLNERGFCVFVAASWFFWYTCQCLLSTANYPLGRAFFFYLLGSFCKTRKAGGRKKPALNLFVFVLCWLAMSFIALATAGKTDKHTANVAMALFTVLSYALVNCLLLPVCAWNLFVFFETLRVKPSRFVNAVAATAFGVYLVHDSEVGRLLTWNGILHVSDVQFVSAYFPVYAVLDIFGVFAACSAIDYLRLRFVAPWMLAWSEKGIAALKARYTRSQEGGGGRATERP